MKKILSILTTLLPYIVIAQHDHHTDDATKKQQMKCPSRLWRDQPGTCPPVADDYLWRTRLPSGRFHLAKKQ